jgi:hypothetical protein
MARMTSARVHPDPGDPASAVVDAPVPRARPGATITRWARLFPFAAGVLWAAQALIWTVAPKVQRAEPPFAIIDRPLFAVFWFAIIGAVA